MTEDKKIFATPKVRKFARELGANVSLIEGSERKGRITEDDVKNLLSGLLTPDISEKITGNVEIREIFSISKIGNIAGCMVKDGIVSRNSQIRLFDKPQIKKLKNLK